MESEFSHGPSHTNIPLYLANMNIMMAELRRQSTLFRVLHFSHMVKFKDKQREVEEGRLRFGSYHIITPLSEKQAH